MSALLSIILPRTRAAACRLPALLLCTSLAWLPAVASAEPPPTRAGATQQASWPRYRESREPLDVDLHELEQRLRHTRAMGLFTKLSVKREVEDLIDCFRRYHRGEPVSVAELRGRFNALFARLGSLLWRKDRRLYYDLYACREQLWVRLVDPSGFRMLLSQRG